jgi:hypothetical protein
MKQSRFPLADLLTILGSIGFGFFCYLSINFYTLGDTTTSITSAVLFAIILAGLAFLCKLLKTTNGNFKTSIIIERVILPIYISVSLIALFPFSHYFYITSKKEAIQKQIIENITNAEGIFAAYESYGDLRLMRYRAQLNSAVARKNNNIGDYFEMGFENGINDNTQINNKLFSCKAQLFPSNYQQMKQVDTQWLLDAKQNITDWSPLAIVEIVNSLKEETFIWHEQLVSYSKVSAKGEVSIPFPFTPTMKDVSNVFTQKSNPTIESMLIGCGFYLLMLVSYFINSRSTKNPYTLFGKRDGYKDDSIDINI